MMRWRGRRRAANRAVKRATQKLAEAVCDRARALTYQFVHIFEQVRARCKCGIMLLLLLLFRHGGRRNGGHDVRLLWLERKWFGGEKVKAFQTVPVCSGAQS
jgi:hypothetical protein